jgi:hypothetical protein
MSSDNEFPIPFEESRRGLAANQEEKAAVGRLGQYLASRGVNRPTIGEGRKRRRSGNIELPTGGKPGQRKPTGSRRDVDGDGWADEGTTKPVWVGAVPDGKKPKQGTEGPKSSSSTVSGRFSSGRNIKAKLNISRYGKDNEYAEVNSFEIDGKKFSVSTGGNSPGRDMYNGYLAAFDENGKVVGRIDYNSDTVDKTATVAMTEVAEEYKRMGIASALLDSLIIQSPDYEISPGYTTDEGAAWWRRVTGGDGPIKPCRLSSGDNEINFKRIS